MIEPSGRVPVSLGVRSVLLLVAALLAVVAAPSAHAFRHEGARWPGHPVRITYFDATPLSYHWSVQQAAAAWNTSGVGVRFVRVRSRAQARVVVRRGHGALGYATQGYAPGAFIELDSCFQGCADKWEMASVAAHEMGHILGLDHEARTCALMNPSDYALCRPSNPPKPWQWRCRILQPDDLAGAVRRYGGTARLAQRQWCDKTPPASAPRSATAVQLSSSPAVPARISWTVGSRTASVAVYRKQGSCPTSTQDHVARLVGTRKGAIGSRQVLDDHVVGVALTAGSHCYRLFSTDRWQRPGGSVTVVLAYKGPPLPPSPTSINLNQSSSGPKIVITVHAPVVSWAPFVEVWRQKGTCPTTPDSPAELLGSVRVGADGVATLVDDQIAAAGRWCYAAFLTDNWLIPSATAATAFLDYTPPP